MIVAWSTEVVVVAMKVSMVVVVVVVAAWVDCVVDAGAGVGGPARDAVVVVVTITAGGNVDGACVLARGVGVGDG